jgi:hypothetical protein
MTASGSNRRTCLRVAGVTTIVAAVCVAAVVAFNSYDAALSIGDAQQARTTAQETKSKAASSAERIRYGEFMCHHVCSLHPSCNGVHLDPHPSLKNPLKPQNPRQRRYVPSIGLLTILCSAPLRTRCAHAPHTLRSL